MTTPETTVSNIETPYGQVNLHHLTAHVPQQSPLICLHPAPFDGSYFSDFATQFDQRLELLAPDYPGHGQSAAPKALPTIDDYVDALLAALDELRPGITLNLLGFHTGCLVACEAALRSPRIGKLVLIDIPYFTGTEQRDKFAANVRVDDPATWGFAAAFRYPCAERFTRVRNPVLAIATGSELAGPTRQAAETLSDVRLKNFPDVTRPALRNGASRFADLIVSFLRS